MRLANKMFGWNLEVVDKLQKTVQFKKNLTIKDSEEMDLFRLHAYNEKR